MINLDFFLIPQGQLSWQPISGQSFGTNIYSAQQHSKTDSNIAILIKTIFQLHSVQI